MFLLSPTVFGMKHLVGTASMMVLIAFALVVTLHWFKDSRGRVLKITALLLVGLEIAKYLYVGSTQGHLPKHMFPLNLCSYSLYVMPFVAFGRGKYVEIVKPFAYSVGLIASLIVFVYPVTVLGSSTFWFPFTGDILPFHSFLYHAVMLYFSLFMVMSGAFTPTWKNAYLSYFGLVIAATISGLTNVILETDFMFLRDGAPNPLYFVKVQHGYLPYLITNIILAAVLIVISYLPFVFKKVSISLVESSVETA